MKTVVVMLEFQTSPEGEWSYVTENARFGKECAYRTANEFLDAIKNLHKKHSRQYRIINVIIG